MELIAQCQTGTVVDSELIIDAHSHMGPWYDFHIPHEGKPEMMVEVMDLCGIDLAIVCPHVGMGPDYRMANRQAHQAAADFHDRFVPFVIVNPNYGAEAAGAEIEYWQQQGQIRAFKIHPSTHQYKASDENYRPVFKYANGHGLPVLSHSWAGDSHCKPEILGQLAAEYPEASIVIAHSGSSWQMLDEATTEAKQHDNVYLDLTGSSLYYGLLEEMAWRVGADRVLFGSDNPFLDPRPGLGRVLMSKLSDDQKRQILGLNAKRVYAL